MIRLFGDRSTLLEALAQEWANRQLQLPSTRWIAATNQSSRAPARR